DLCCFPARRSSDLAARVPGAGTGAMRAGLAALLKPGQRLLVHDAPVYPTTRVIIEQMGLTLITVDFNDLSALKQVVDEQQPDAALVQHTDRKSTRLNSSHVSNSYAVFCLKKKKKGISSTKPTILNNTENN